MEPETTTSFAPAQTESAQARGYLAPARPLLKNPMVWLGLGAVIIVFLGSLFLFSKEPSKSTATTPPAGGPTSVTTVMEPTGSIEIQEQKDADAIQVGDSNADLNQIDQQVNQL